MSGEEANGLINGSRDFIAAEVNAEPPMSGSSGDEAVQTLTTFLNGMPTPKERLNAAIRTLLDERGQCRAGTNLGAGSSQMGPGDEAAGRVRRFLEAWAKFNQDYPSIDSGFGDDTELTTIDLRALLDEREQLLGKRDIATQIDRLAIEGLSALHQRAAVERDEATARAERAEAKAERLKAEYARCADLHVGGRGPQVVEVSAWPAPEERLSDEEFASFQAAIAECRGGEEGGNHGDA